MGDEYWRLEHIVPAEGDDRCVMLYGAEDEIVGPMTLELAEAWIDYFDNRRRTNDRSPVDLSKIVPHKRTSVPRRK
jgi:hypothetical protein